MALAKNPVAINLVSELTTWFDTFHRPLPWRTAGTSAWAILVSEVMSQQTPIARVIPVWHEWMAVWPTPTDLVCASDADVIRAWGRLGYPRRALRLKEAAGVIIENFGGEVPSSEVDLLTLPGVGAYTAAAVVAFAHRGRSVVLDTNIRRVLSRVIDGVALPSLTPTVSERSRADTIVPEDPGEAAKWNAAVMEFGALICSARAPLCHACPVSICAWKDAGYPNNAPARRRQDWEGSNRQIRGRIMAVLREAPHYLEMSFELLHTEAKAASPLDLPSFKRALGELVVDGLVAERAGNYSLPS